MSKSQEDSTGSTGASGSSDPRLSDPRIKLGTDEFGFKHAYSQSVWRGETIVHNYEFKQIPELLESFQKYEPRPDDVWMCSFPKSGTNWTFEILHILLSGKLESSKSTKMTSMVETSGDIAEFDSQPSPRIMNTHVNLKFLPPSLFKSKIIFSIRNPLSVALSAYHHLMSTNEEPVKYPGSPRDYILAYTYESRPTNNKALGTPLFGAWFDLVPLWWKTYKDNPNVLFLFYEDMRRNPLDNVRKISDFLGKSYSEDFLNKVVELTSLDTLKKSCKEKTNYHNTENLHLFYRKGQIDEWKEHIKDEDLQHFRQYFARRMTDVPDLVEKIQFE